LAVDSREDSARYQRYACALTEEEPAAGEFERATNGGEPNPEKRRS
jgi:hypothetical protein